MKNKKDKLQKDLSLKNSTVFQNEIYFLNLNEEIGYLKRDIEDLEKQSALAESLKIKIEAKEELNEKLQKLKKR